MLTSGYYIISFMSIAERDQSKGSLLYTRCVWSKGVASMWEVLTDIPSAFQWYSE